MLSPEASNGHGPVMLFPASRAASRVPYPQLHASHRQFSPRAPGPAAAAKSAFPTSWERVPSPGASYDTGRHPASDLLWPKLVLSDATDKRAEC